LGYAHWVTFSVGGGTRTCQATARNVSAFLLRATMPAAHAVCDDNADPASSKCLLDGTAVR